MGKKRRKARGITGIDNVVRYPWVRWFAYKRPFLLRKRWEFFCQTHSMAVQVRNAAAMHGKKVSIKTVGDDLHITVTKKPRSRK